MPVGNYATDDIEATATLWAVRVEGQALLAEDEVALEAWLAADVRHLGAYARAMAMIVHVGRIKALRGGDHDDHGRSPGGPSPQVTAWHRVASLPTRRRFLAAASVGVAVCAAGFAVMPWQAAATTYSTKRGEIRRVSLDDGSAMTLNTETTARVSFTNRERRVDVVAGEVLFDVARDAGRPFIVTMGRSTIRADRTSFTVSKLDRAPVDITVRSGRVELVDENLAPVALIASNTRATVSSAGGAVASQPIATARIDQEMAWQKGMLSFEDMPLAQAVAQFARYNNTPIRLTDPDLGEETITGLYSARDPRGFARSVAMSLGMSISEQPGAITLSHRANKN